MDGEGWHGIEVEVVTISSVSSSCTEPSDVVNFKYHDKYSDYSEYYSYDLLRLLRLTCRQLVTWRGRASTEAAVRSRAAKDRNLYSWSLKKRIELRLACSVGFNRYRLGTSNSSDRSSKESRISKSCNLL